MARLKPDIFSLTPQWLYGRAYLNYLIFDENFVYQSGGFKELSGAGSTYTRIFLDDIPVNYSGYMIAYVSYESDDADRAFFDDFKVTHTPSAVIQTDDYYPFGLTFNSYTSGTENLYKYNGKEEQKETQWYDYGARMFDPALGRFFTQDAYAEKYLDLAPYQYALNNPILFVDINGDSVDISDVEKNGRIYSEQLKKDQGAVTGLQLTSNNGNLEYATRKGVLGGKKAVVSRDSDGKKIGSAKARRALKKAIDSDDVVNVVLDMGGGNHVPRSSPNEIHYDPVEIADVRAARSSDLNELSPMIFQHELGHTTVGGGRSDPPRSQANSTPGANVRRINSMRRQLGQDFGRRVIYGGYPVTSGGTRYFIMPFSKRSLRAIRKGNMPTGKHLSF